VGKSVRCGAEDNGELELTLCNFAQIEVGVTQPLLMFQPLGLVRPLLVLKRRDRARVIGSETLVVVVRRAVSFEVGNRNDWLVDWELLIIHTETIAMSVRVGEQTGLQDRICRWFDTRNKVRGRESGLLNLGEVVLGVLVENNLPKLAEGEVLVRPDLGEVEDVVAEFFGLLCRHDLLRYNNRVSKAINYFPQP